MSQHYCDYKWKNGIPWGVNPCNDNCGIAYKIIADPYYKRISIEKYKDNKFEAILYDSALFDFRHLKPMHQSRWQKETIEENEQFILSEIRNEEDRLILMEKYSFEKGRCIKCVTHSPHGILISTQKIMYEEFGDAYNGVLLFDSHDHLVLEKRYAIDETSKEFSELLSESWT